MSPDKLYNSNLFLHRVISLAALLLLYFLPMTPVLAATSPAGLLKKADDDRQSLLASTSVQQKRDNWLKCISQYEKIINSYPKSNEAPWAVYHSGGLYTGLYRYSGKKSDIESALSKYNIFETQYTTHKLADDALYKKGLIYLDILKDDKKAAKEFSDLISKYPDGDMKSNASLKLKALSSKQPKTTDIPKVEQVPNKTPVSGKNAIEAADKARKELLASESKKKYRDQWLKVINAYLKVPDVAPEAPVSMFRAAGLYYQLYKYSKTEKDLGSAIDLYRKIVDTYPEHSYADDAQCAIGEIFYKDKEDLTQAYIEFLKVDIKFPDGDMKDKAKEYLDSLSAVIGDSYIQQQAPVQVGIPQTQVNPASSHKDGGYANITGIRHWSTPAYTRIVVDVDKSVKYESNLLKADPGHNKPRRLYIDVMNARVQAAIGQEIPIKDGLLKGTRAAQFKPDVVRIVLDSESIGTYNVFHLFDPFRIVVDVQRSSDSQSKDVIKALPPPVSTSNTTRKPERGIKRSENPPSDVSIARQLGLTVKKIVVDPGHGGKDPGCMDGSKKIREKDIVLSLANILVKELKAKIGCEVELTRSSDVFLPLERRTAIANMQKADLFISLHVNAHKDKRVNGIETYFLNMATDESAVLVAARENATTEKNLSDLQSILNDLMLNTKIKESSRLAHEVQRGMINSVGQKYSMKSLGVKQAPFYVFIGAGMPAVLIEIGFITNQAEMKKITTAEYQQNLSAGITKGIMEYIKSIEISYISK